MSLPPGGDDDAGAYGSGWGLGGPVDPAASQGFGVDEGDRYVAMGRLGVGGMGVVDAVHDRRLDRQVARKLPRDALGDDVGVALLAHEARVTARLDHPHVVPVHDAGVGPDGRPYFTMRLIRGRSLTQVLADGAVGLAARLRLLLDVCRALAHAHDLGIVHTDLKPDNVLVGPHGEVQVGDWGLARFLDPTEAAPPLVRGAGTPPWRAPEAAVGGAITPAADVYAVGVMLGQALGAVDAAPVALQAVLRRATAADPSERYPDGGALAEELERWLDGRPVLAHAYTPLEMLSRLVRVWRAPLAVAAVSTLLLGTGAGLAARRTAADRDRALALERQYRGAAAEAQAAQAAVALANDDRPAAVRLATSSLRLQPTPEARGVLTALGGDPPASRVSSVAMPGCDRLARADGAGVLCGDGRTVAWRDAEGEELQRWAIDATDAVRTSDGGLLAQAGGSLWRIATGGARTTIRPAVGSSGLARGPGGLFIDHVQLTLAEDGVYEVRPCEARDNVDVAQMDDAGTWWTVCSHGRTVRGDRSGAWSVLAEHGDLLRAPSAMARMAGSAGLIVGTLDGYLARLDPTTGAIRWRVPSAMQAPTVIAVAPDGVHGVVVGRRGEVLLFRAEDGLGLGRLDVSDVVDAAWVDARAVHLVARGGTLETWRLGDQPRPYRWQEQGGVGVMALDPEERLLAVGVGPDLVVRTLPEGRVLRRASLHALTLKGLIHDHGRVLTGAADSVGGWLDVATGSTGRIPEPGPRMRRFVQLDNGLIAALFAPRLQVWDEADGPARDLLLERTMRDLVPAADSGSAFGLDEDGVVLRIWLSPDRTEVLGRRPADGLAVSPAAGRLALMLAGQGAVAIVDAELEEVARCEVDAEPTSLVFDDSGSHVVIGTIDGRVVWCDASDGAVVAVAPGHTERVSSLVRLADGGVLSAGWDGVVRRWSAPSFDVP